MKQIFPKEIIENTIEVHQFSHSTKSKAIYALLLTALLTVFVLLPFINVTIHSSARGIIKPNKERVLMNTINSGRIVSSNLVNNSLVKKGDTLLMLDATVINEKIKLSNTQIKDLELFVEDLSVLTSLEKIKFKKIISPKYQKEYLLLQEKLINLQTRYEKALHDYNRNKTLYNKDVIAKVEFENIEFEYNLSKNRITELKQQQRSIWQTNLAEYKNTLIEFESKKEQLFEDISHYTISAPIDGTLLSVSNLAPGTYVNVGHTFAEISPNTELLVECFVSPSDIGLLNDENKTSFQVDAFNYNQWGLVTGKIIDIGKDIEMINNEPVFKIRCMMNEQSLQLKNGFIGKLKKGMSLTAQFEVIDRSLFDLLYDKMDDWLNPSRNEITSLKS